MKASGLPQAQGLYDPSNEHDNCGVGFICNIKNKKSHEIIRQGLQILVNLDHRGAVGADPLAGDGAGIIMQIPHDLLVEECAKLGFDLPEIGEYAVGQVFLPQDDKLRDACVAAFDKVVPSEGQELLGWRDVPVDNSYLGESVKADEPVIRQIFIKKAEGIDLAAFERKLFVIRKQVHHAIWDIDNDRAGFYLPSLSTHTIVYKGMVLSSNLSRLPSGPKLMVTNGRPWAAPEVAKNCQEVFARLMTPEPRVTWVSVPSGSSMVTVSGSPPR